MASGLGKICCFPEREECRAPCATRLGWEQVWCWMRGRDPSGAPGHLQAGSAGSGGSCRAVGLPKLFRVSPDIYYGFCLGFFFFSSWEKSLDAVREGREGRCPCGPCGLQPRLAVLARSKPQGCSALRPFPWNCFPFPGLVPAGRRVQAGGTRSHGRCPQ